MKLKMRYSFNSLIILELIIVLIIMPYLIVGLLKPKIFLIPKNWIPIILCIGMGLFIFKWLDAFELNVENDVLNYKSLFSKRIQVPIKDITEAKIELENNKYSDRFRPTFRLVIKSKEPLSQVFDINLKVFRRADIYQLLKLLQIKNKQLA